MTDITSFYKGETVQVYVSAKNPDGTPLSDPGDQTIIFNIAKSNGGIPIITLDSHFILSLANSTVSKYLITIPANDIELLEESKTYFYNIWSKKGSNDPRLQVPGKITLIPSII